MNAKPLLSTVAIIELLAGAGFLVAPSTTAELLVGQPLSPGVATLVGRVAGMALIAIGTICWLEKAGDRVESATSVLIGLLLYNAALPVLLVHSYVVYKTGGIGLWSTVILHMAFAVWTAVCIRHDLARGRPRE